MLRSQARHALGVAVLALTPGPVLALGLGQLQVKSGPGQPLVADIAIISNDPTELQGLQARLAAPETFQRIGLAPPAGIVSDLQFAPVVDEQGRPVIRVTSRAPVQQATLSFLVEVDWGQGRLVREYSALIDPPRTVAAPMAPPVQMPIAAPAPVIQRSAVPPASAPPAEAGHAEAPSAPASPALGAAPRPPVDPRPVPAPAPIVTSTPTPASPEPTPVQRPAVAVAPTAAPPAPSASVDRRAAVAPAPRTFAARQRSYGPVKRGQTLSVIAADLAGGEGFSLDQTMLALLRTNPDAFIGEDINRLREGAVLRMPNAQELSRYSASQAAGLVREQVANWRQGQRAQAQPAASPSATAGTPSTRVSAQMSANSRRQPTQARLTIAPPGAASAARAGIQSGISAGGEGDMLKQDLQQTRENLAARDAEVQELKARVAELERLQKDQQRLITMKDNALAGAQQVPVSAVPTQQGVSWAWTLLLLLVVAAIAWWLGRWRRAIPGADPRTAQRPDPMAASRAPAVGPNQPNPPLTPAGTVSEQRAAVLHDASAADMHAPDMRASDIRVSDIRASDIGAPATAEQSAAPAGGAAETSSAAEPVPVWVGKTRATAKGSLLADSPASLSKTRTNTVPTWVGGAAGSMVSVRSAKRAGPEVSSGDRIELARAYLDQGDRMTARRLLQDVAASGDPAARKKAARLLQSIA